jgi:hydroxypyruvate isomerase
MITLSVCLEPLYTTLPVDERIAKIAEAGFRSVEFWHPEGTWDGASIRTDRAKDAGALRLACARHGVALNDFALHAWDGSFGGCPVRRPDRARYLEQIRKMIAFAEAAGCRKGITLSGTGDPSLSRTEMRKNLEDALAEAVRIAERADFTLLLEPLNTLVDHPGYYLDSSAEAVEIVRALGSPHLKLLYDVYHMQIMEGNLLATIEKNIAWIGHFHAAGVPGRGELFGSELNYPFILAKIEALGYQGAFGLEYFPKLSDHGQSLRDTLAYLSRALPERVA